MLVSKNRFVFGFEFESIVNKTSRLIQSRADYHCGSFNDVSFLDYQFKIEKDNSVYPTDNLEDCGVEIISRPYRLDTEQFYRLKKNFLSLMDFADYIGVNSTCGLHISFSIEDLSLPSCFSLVLLRDLRQRILNRVNRAIFNQSYFRLYADEIKGYKDYQKTRNLEFNIRNNYIEWRAIHCRHLQKYENKALLEQVFKFICMVNRLIIRRVNYFFARLPVSESLEVLINNQAQENIFPNDKTIFIS